MTYHLSREQIDDPDQLRRFVSAVFARRGVNRLDLYTATGEARATLSTSRAARPPVVPPLYLRPAPPLPIRIFRHGRMLSTWELAHHVEGRARFRHPALKSRPRVADAVQQLVGQMEGVRSTRVAPEAATLVVAFEPERLAWPALLPVLEDALIEGWPGALPAPKSAHLPALGATGVILATAADSGTPGMEAFMTGWTMLRALPLWRETCHKLARSRVDLSSIQSARALLTLFQGRFLPGELADYLALLWEGHTRRRDFADRAAPIWLMAAVAAWLLDGPERCAAVLRADLEGPDAIPVVSLAGAVGALAGLWGSYTNIALGQIEMLAAQAASARKKKATRA